MVRKDCRLKVLQVRMLAWWSGDSEELDRDCIERRFGILEMFQFADNGVADTQRAERGNCSSLLA